MLSKGPVKVLYDVICADLLYVQLVFLAYKKFRKCPLMNNYLISQFMVYRNI